MVKIPDTFVFASFNPINEIGALLFCGTLMYFLWEPENTKLSQSIKFLIIIFITINIALKS